jgi:hypothetical protein
MSEIIMAKIKVFKIIMEKPTTVKLTIILNWVWVYWLWLG